MAKDYWKDRQAQALTNLTNKSAKSIEAQLKKYYKQTMQRAIADFEATYDKLLATMEDGREPTPADLYKLDKYWQTQAQLKTELQRLGDKEAALFSKQFETSYKGVYDSLARDSGAHYSRISTEGAQQMIKQVWAADGKVWSERIWDNTAALADTLNEKLIECVVGGKKTSDLKKALMERFGVSYNNADMLARTELAHIQTQAARQRYEDTGVEYVQIWADKDERRCDVCGKLHEKIYPVGATMPIPAHPRCRCTIVPVVDIPEEDIIEQQQQQPQAQSGFVAANTVDEAQAYADKYVQTYKTIYNGNVSYKGLDTEHANAVNKALTRVYDDYDIEPLRNIKTMNFRENRFKTAVDDGTAAAYQWGGGGDLFVNHKLLGNKKLEKAFKDRANGLLKTVIDGAEAYLKSPNIKDTMRNYINALLNTKRQCVAQAYDADFTEITIFHEMGHALHDKIFWKYGKTTKNPNGIDFAESMSKYGGNISGYAISNYREYIAESFAAYYCGEADKLDPEIVKMFEGAKKKK